MRIKMLLVLTLVACSSSPEQRLPYYNSAEFSPRWLEQSELPADFHKVPEFSLTNQHGKNITEQDLNDKITVVDFFFTFCPGICPVLTKNMAVVVSAFPKDNQLVFLSHTVTPKHDTVAKLKAFAEEKQITATNWHLLTGDRELIYQLGREVYFAEESLGKEKSPDEFLHTENFVLIDQNRHLRGIYNGLNKASVQQLVADIKLLQRER